MQMELVLFDEHGAYQNYDRPTHRTQVEKSSQFSNHHQNASRRLSYLPKHNQAHMSDEVTTPSWTQRWTAPDIYRNLALLRVVGRDAPGMDDVSAAVVADLRDNER